VTHPVVERRRREQAARVTRAEAWSRDLALRVPGVRAVVVFGSVARGDFNKWSDIDVLVVADALPDRLTARAELLSPVPPGVQPIAWTCAELALARAQANPIACEADGQGIVVYGAL
jgi:hypothetical protein